MLRSAVLLACAAACTAAAQAPAPTAFPLDRVHGLTLVGTRAEPVDYRGRQALKLLEAAGEDGEALAIVDDARIRNGEIRIDVAGLPAAGAAEGARGFIGVAFRLRRDPLRYECFYIRPTNGRANDQLRRNHATQYISYPDFPWFLLREKHPGVYESYADMEAGAWTRLRIAVDGTRAQLFVNNASQPSLIVNDLKHGESEGNVALWIGQGTEAYFGPLTVTRLPRDPAF
jgi:hypothetical protein